MRQLQIVLLAALLTACKANASGATAQEPPKAPLIVGGGENTMPEGFRTSLALKNGETLELGYTQVTALEYGAGMAIELMAEDGRLPAKRLAAHFDVGTPKPVRAEDLQGRILQPATANGVELSLRAGSLDDTYKATSATLAITKVTAGAVDGTISADFGHGRKVEAAPFHAYRTEALGEASMATIARITP